MTNTDEMLDLFKQLVDDGKIHLIKSEKLGKLIYLVYKKKFDKSENNLIIKVKKFLAQKNKLFFNYWV